MAPRPVKEKGKRWDGFECSGGVLDAAIWEKLPLDIQGKLLEHLPFPALVRLQLVCKAWYKGIRSINQVTAHGDCYVARVMGEKHLRVYSSLHEGTLEVPQPPCIEGLGIVCTTTDGLVYYGNQKESCVCNLFTGKRVSFPDLVVEDLRANVIAGEGGEYTVIRLADDARHPRMSVYQSGHGGDWKTTYLQLPAGDELAMSLGALAVTVHDSTFYFLTVDLQQTPELVSLRCIDLRGNIDGTSTKVFSWSTLPMTGYSSFHQAKHIWNHHGRYFTGNIAVAGGSLFMVCMRLLDPREPDVYTVAVLVCNKRAKRWDWVSEMPLTEGFRAWQPHDEQFVELWGQGDTLVVSNHHGLWACLYNTSTKVWSLLGDGLEDVEILEPCHLKLQMRF